MKQLRNLILSSLLLLGFSTVALPTAAAYATPQSTVCSSIGGCTSNPNSSGSVNGIVKLVVNILSILLGVTAIIMIMVSGFRLITSGGNPQNVANARNTLIYAVVGLVVAVSARTIVYFIFQKVK